MDNKRHLRKGSLTEVLSPLQTLQLRKSNSVKSSSFKSSDVDWNVVSMRDHYECVKILGSGAQANAYLLSDKHLPNTQVVAKIYRNTPSNMETVTNEIKVLKLLNFDGCKPFLLCFQQNFISKVSDLPTVCTNIKQLAENTVLVVVYDYFFGKGTIDFQKLMSYIDLDEEDLDSLPKEENERIMRIQDLATSPDYQLTLILTLIKSVAYLHEKHVAHMDLKPANVILNIESGRIQLIDFGMSCMENMCAPAGTATHMSPEIIKNHGKTQEITRDPISRRTVPERTKTNKVLSIRSAMLADAWSIGVLIFQYVHGTRPFIFKVDNEQSLLYKVSHAVQTDIYLFNLEHPDSDVNEAINTVINGFLQVDPEQRMSVLEAKEILEPLMGKEPSSPKSLHSASPLRSSFFSSPNSPTSPSFFFQ